MKRTLALLLSLTVGAVPWAHADQDLFGEWSVKWTDNAKAANPLGVLCFPQGKDFDRGAWYVANDKNKWKGDYQALGVYGMNMVAISSDGGAAITFSLNMEDRTATNLTGTYMHLDKATGKVTTQRAQLTKTKKKCPSL
jgi:hypothetical protein